MKKTAIILILVLSVRLLWAEYTPKSLYEMSIKADKIIYGTIIKLDSSKYSLRIEGSLTGDTGTIDIIRFKNWPCAYRWTEYQVGQKHLLFLLEKNGHFYTMSGGNEGELPIQGDSVYIHGLSLRPPPPPLPIDRENDTILVSRIYEKEYFECGHHSVYNSDFSGQPIKLDSFLKTINAIRDCFDFDYGEFNEILNSRVKCSREDIKEKTETDKIFRWTFQELIK